MGQETPGNSNLPTQDEGNALTKERALHLASAAVVSRFLARMAILGVCAVMGTHGYARTLESLLELAALYCVIIAPFRREDPFGPALTHFDEGAAYALSACVVFCAS